MYIEIIVLYQVFNLFDEVTFDVFKFIIEMRFYTNILDRQNNLM